MPSPEFSFWGALLLDSGDASETDAALSEAGLAEWDRGQEYLDRNELHIDGRKVPTPFYWALPAVTTLLLLDEELAEQTLSHRRDT